MSFTLTNEEKGLLISLRAKVRSKTQKCYNPPCINEAIRSHIHQAEGPIREISPNGRIVQLEETNPFFSETKYKFQEKGIKHGDVLTFWGFCNSCDTLLFKEIESDDIDFDLYRAQLLFSYRGFLSEHYKQEYNIKHYLEIFNSNDLSTEIKENYRLRYFQFLLLVKQGRLVKTMFESDLDKETKHFEFISFKIPRIEICTSTAYTFPFVVSLDDRLKSDLEKLETFPLINTPLFVNLIPSGKHLVAILGCISDKKLEGRIDLNEIQ